MPCARAWPTRPAGLTHGRRQLGDDAERLLRGLGAQGGRGRGNVSHHCIGLLKQVLEQVSQDDAVKEDLERLKRWIAPTY